MCTSAKYYLLGIVRPVSVQGYPFITIELNVQIQ